MQELGLEVETLEEPMCVSSPLGTRASIYMICWYCELKISGIMLTVDLRVMICQSSTSCLGGTG